MEATTRALERKTSRKLQKAIVAGTALALCALVLPKGAEAHEERRRDRYEDRYDDHHHDRHDRYDHRHDHDRHRTGVYFVIDSHGHHIYFRHSSERRWALSEARRCEAEELRRIEVRRAREERELRERERMHRRVERNRRYW